MEHRTDIDGLRAVAVLSVILAHAGVPFLQGGFLGVDVFFVISGFLITRIIRDELEGRTFSLLRFYERRARRILPALLVVVATCIPFALWLLLPEFLENFSQSVVATLLFSNNLLLAWTSGYWELESQFKPLLHTWSLGVEEQFYIAFPLLMLLVVRHGRRAQIAVLALLALASFAMAEHGWRHYPDASFYLPTTRAWELLVGSLACYVPERTWRAGQALSLGALVAVLAPMALFDHATPSPSVWSAVPVLGTAGVLLFNRPGNLAWRLLSLRPAVFVGLISYSAYLWHQPVLAFARAASLEPLNAPVSAGLVVLTLVLAAVSWRYVEVPCRKRDVVKLRPLLLTIGAASVAMVAMGLVGHFQRGFPQWTYPNIAGSDDVYIAYNERIRDYASGGFTDNGKSNIALVGNSFARDVGNVMIEAGMLGRANLVYVVQDEAGGGGLDDTGSVLREADLVVLAAGMIDVGQVPDEATLRRHEVNAVREWIEAVDKATEAPVVVFGSKSFGYNLNPFGRIPVDRRGQTMAQVPPLVRGINDDLRRMAGERYIDTIRLLGPDGVSVHVFDKQGNPLTPDRNHLTRYGAQFLARRLDETSPPAWRRLKEAVEPE